MCGLKAKKNVNKSDATSKYWRILAVVLQLEVLVSEQSWESVYVQ